MNRNTRRRRQVNANDQMIVNSNKPTGESNTFFPKEDYFRRRSNWQLTQSPPRVISNQIYWIQAKTESTTTISSSGDTEANFVFKFNELTDIVGVADFFDQYCIYSVLINLMIDEGAIGVRGVVVTALDFDSVTSLGSLPAIEAYESAVTTKVVAGQSIQRLLHPTALMAVIGGSGTFNNSAISRSWISSLNTDTQHFGYRSYFSGNTVTTALAIFSFTFVIGLRNNV
jgi:hypothetical protein